MCQVLFCSPWLFDPQVKSSLSRCVGRCEAACIASAGMHSNAYGDLGFFPLKRISKPLKTTDCFYLRG